LKKEVKIKSTFTSVKFLVLYKFKVKIHIIFFTLFLILTLNCYTQSEPYFFKKYPDTLNKKRLAYVLGGQGVIYAGTLALLYQAWYKDYPQSSFHWIDDGKEWMGVDKIGHATTSAYIGKFGYEFYRWAGVDRKKAIWYGGSSGFFYLTIVEILDGFSAQWGASYWDLLANTAGTGLFIGQQLGWDEQRFVLKWSYHPTQYAEYMPDQLGSSTLERALKDYNGQTYWLSGNIKAFLPKRSKFPGWISVSVGYGAEGMLGAKTNPSFDSEGNPLPDYPRFSQYFLSLDVDFSKIKTRSHFLKFLLNGLNFIKFPFPTIEYNNENGFVFHYLYF